MPHTTATTTSAAPRHALAGQLRQLSSGEIQPVAYLAAWVQKGADLASKEDHMAKGNLPDVEDTRAVMQREEWL